MPVIKVGDFVTTCEAGFWQLIELKPKIADEDYVGANIRWKKGDVIGQWAVVKKAFTPKMKPRIDFSYLDSSWLKPVSAEVLSDICEYFRKYPEYKQRFDVAEVELRPMITNCWLDLPEDQEGDFRKLLGNLPREYSMDQFWKKAKKYKKYIVPNPPSHFLLNLFTYPWKMDKKSNLLYFEYDLKKM